MTARGVLALLALAVLLAGCGGANANAPKVTSPDPLTSRKEKREEAPVLIAPPPAYGNKIVMADRSAARAPAM